MKSKWDFLKNKIFLGIDISPDLLLFLKRGLKMSVRLQIFEHNGKDDNPFRRNFRFAVVDYSKSQNYPSNFVCMLPLKLGVGKPDSVFLKVYGNKSLEQAKILLTGALKAENDAEIKAEIERRLKLLDPTLATQIKCSSCGKLFQPQRIRRYKKNFCQVCMKKRYGNR